MVTILDAARAALVDEGHAAFSLRGVATRASVRLGHLQYYFASRQALLRAVIERELALSLPTAPRDANAAAAPDLDALVEAILKAQQEPDTIRLQAEIRALANHDPTVAELLRRHASRHWRTLTDTLARTSPALRRPVIERRAALLVALLEGLMLFRSPERPGELPLPGLGREVADLARHLRYP